LHLQNKLSGFQHSDIRLFQVGVPTMITSYNERPSAASIGWGVFTSTSWGMQGWDAQVTDQLHRVRVAASIWLAMVSFDRIILIWKLMADGQCLPHLRQILQSVKDVSAYERYTPNWLNSSTRTITCLSSKALGSRGGWAFLPVVGRSCINGFNALAIHMCRNRSIAPGSTLQI
jgi:hypothetical protein